MESYSVSSLKITLRQPRPGCNRALLPMGVRITEYLVYHL